MTGPLTLSEKFYIESHFSSKTPDEIAKDLGRKVKTISGHIELCEASKATSDPPLDKDGQIQVGQMLCYKGGGMANNAAQSAIADEASAKEPERNEEFFSVRARNAIGKIWPNLPSY